MTFKYRPGIWLALLLLVCGCNSKLPPNKLKVGEQAITIEVADNSETRRQGLSDRVFLEENHGMLFVFPQAGPQSFWMYHCHIDIDLAYIDPNGVILEIIQMKKEPFDTPPNLLKTYPSTAQNVQYVLEMNGGWYKRHNISPGISLDLAGHTASY